MPITPTIQSMYDAATAILRQCAHVGKQSCEVRMSRNETLMVCSDCYNAQVYAWRAARKAQLAERPNDCDRCAARPHTYEYGGYRLCGRCLKATRAEHNKGLAAAGVLAIFATHVLVDTQSWAGRKTMMRGK